MRNSRSVDFRFPVIALALLGACGKTEKPAEQAAAAPAPNLVHVTAAEYSFQAPDTLPSGVTTFHLMNQGKQIHHMVVVKMSSADFQKMDMNAPPPADLVVLGGPNAAPPGGTAEATLDLTPGSYTLVCFVPGPDGKPHFMSGMMHGLTVTQGSSAAVAPAADITVKLSDYTFELSAPLTAGHHVIRIENAGPQMHEMVFVKLEAGKKTSDFAQWALKPNGPPPGMPINGAAPMTVGSVNTVSVDLTPGEYGLVCFIGDLKDQKPHLVHGMIKQLTVN